MWPQKMNRLLSFHSENICWGLTMSQFYVLGKLQQTKQTKVITFIGLIFFGRNQKQKCNRAMLINTVATSYMQQLKLKQLTEILKS